MLRPLVEALSKTAARRNIRLARQWLRNISDGLKEKEPDYPALAQQAMQVQGEMAELIEAWEER